MESETLSLAHSPFVPVAIGFFGPGAGYVVWGGQAVFFAYATAIQLALGSRA